MIRTQISAPALLALPFKPLRVWLINQRLQQSERDLEVIKMQRKQLHAEERQEHERQVWLTAKRNAIERQ